MATRASWLLPRTVSDGQTREDTRLATSGAMTPDGALTSRAGVIPGGTPFDLVGTGAMTFTIGTGRAFVQGTTAQGAYHVVNTTAAAFTAVDGHATNPRIDLYVLKVYDHFIDSSGSTMAQIERVAGTAASSPVAPSVPAGSIPLWELRVPAGASAGGGGIQGSPGWATARTSRIQYTTASGGIVPSGGPSWNGAYTGQYRDNTTTGRPERWNGSTWVDVLAGAAWGRAGWAYQATGMSAFSALTMVTSLSFTVTMSTSRRYMAQSLLTWFADNAAAQAYLSIRYVAGGSINSNGSGTTELTAVRPHAKAAGDYEVTAAYLEFNGLANGSVTFGAFGESLVAPHVLAIANNSGNSLSVRDIGPSV
jgi:hypothetical protein